MSFPTQNRSFRRRASQPISWLSTEKLKNTQGLDASYDLWAGNEEGPFWFQRFINSHLLTYLDTYRLT